MAKNNEKIVQSLLNVKIVDNLLRIQNAEAIETMLQLARGPFRLLQSVLSFDNTVISQPSDGAVLVQWSSSLHALGQTRAATM